MSDATDTASGLGIFIFFIGLVIAQAAAAYVGIGHHFGTFWAIAAIAAAALFRFTLPVVIGAFFGATNVWGWHWLFALIFVAPGLLFMVPAFAAAMFSAFGRRSS